MSVGPAAITDVPAGSLRRGIGFVGGGGIMLGIIIGGGIFQSPAGIARVADSPISVLAFWAAGGALALFGAFTYAELATMFPESGGIYVFLREGYGRMVAFIFGWTYMFVAKPFAAGGIAIVFGAHLNVLLHVDWDVRISTCAAIVVLTWINVLGVRLGAGVAAFLTAIKIGVLVAIIVLGMTVSAPAPVAAGPPLEPVSALMAITVAMTHVLWTYDGWSDVGAVAGEVHAPQRLLPRIFIVGTLLVMLIYLAVNLAYMRVMPLHEMRALPPDGAIAPTVVERLIGPAGGMIVTWMILVSTLGATHGSILTGARVSFAQARDGLLFAWLGRVHPRYATPATSLWFQALLSCIAIISFGTFEQMISGFTFTMWIFYGLAGLALILLRVRRPDLPRPFRCPGYPVVPLVFVASAIAMTGLAIYDSPGTTLPWLAVLAAGAPAYWLWIRSRGRAAAA